MDRKELLLTAGRSLFFMLVVVFSIGFFHIRGYWGYILTVLAVQMAFNVAPVLVQNSKKYVKTIVMLSILFFLIRFLGAYGIVGLVMTIILLAAYRIFKARTVFMESIRSIETMIFGKPLDRKSEEDEYINIEGKDEGRNDL